MKKQPPLWYLGMKDYEVNLKSLNSIGTVIDALRRELSELNNIITKATDAVKSQKPTFNKYSECIVYAEEIAKRYNGHIKFLYHKISDQEEDLSYGKLIYEKRKKQLEELENIISFL